MKKTIHILSVISLVAAIVGAALMTVCVLGQSVLGPALYGWGLELPFVVPVSYIITAANLLACAFLMKGGKQGKNIGREITVIILLLVVPRINYLISYVQSLPAGHECSCRLSFQFPDSTVDRPPALI